MRRRLRKLEIDSGFKDDDRDIEPEDSEEDDDDDDFDVDPVNGEAHGITEGGEAGNQV